MFTRHIAILSIPCALGCALLSGCGGSSDREVMYLPIGLQRGVSLTLPAGHPAAGTSYVFGFRTVSVDQATILDGKSAGPCAGSIMVIKYQPADDTCQQLKCTWNANRDGETVALTSTVTLHDIKNITKDIGTIGTWVIDYDPWYAEVPVNGTNGRIEPTVLQ